MKSTASYIQALALGQKLDSLLNQLNDQSAEVLVVRSLVNAAWALTPTQKVFSFPHPGHAVITHASHRISCKICCSISSSKRLHPIKISYIVPR